MNIFDRLAGALGFSNSDQGEERLLKGLDQVPWESLQHAYGSATDTPGHLRNLASPDGYTRMEARERLSETIYHQGSIYPAAVATVPFLVELLEAGSVPEKNGLLDLLAKLAGGGSWHESHQHLDLFEKEREKPEFQARLAEERSWVAELHKEINQHGEVFIRLLNDAEQRNRLSASHLLSYLPGLKSRSVPALTDRLERETDQAVRANILRGLFALDRDYLGPFFEQAWERERDDLPRCVALNQHVLQAKDAASPQALDQLLELALSADEALIERYNALPGPGEYLSDMAVPLALASPEHRARALPWFIAQVEGWPMVTDNCATGLLAVALIREGRITDFGELNDLQKRAVLAIARMAWPTPNRVFGNMVGVLRNFGLPGNPEELGALLDQPLF